MTDNAQEEPLGYPGAQEELREPFRLRRFVPVHSQRCSNCQFSVRQDHGQNEAYLCRRYPPAPVPTVHKNIAGQVTQAIDFHYPNMMAHGWCGEWQPEIKGNA